MSSDPLGRPWLDALERARRAGEPPARLRITRPPRACAGFGLLRVVAVRPGNEWVLAYEGYVRLNLTERS